MKITGKTRVAGVMGWPVMHSRSPLIHNHWIARHGVDAVYIPYAVPPNEAEAAIRALPKLGFAGSNVTAPHKLAAFETVDRHDAAAAAIGALNTIIVEADGSLTGSNTDAPGFLGHLQASAPSWSASSGPAVVLGAGGAARAAIYALLEAGAPQIRIANRTKQRAEALVELFGPKVNAFDWSERAAMLAGANLVTNTTTLGMTGQAPLDLPLDDLPGTAVVYDIVYAPLETPLLAAARVRGNACVDGLGMLLHQAVPGFAGWFGITPKVDDALRTVILEDLA